MKDLYKHDHDGVMVVVSILREKTSGYNDIVTKLNNLVISIGESSSWKDIEVKTSFINTCNDFIASYNRLISSMEDYINYLEKKSEDGDAIETAYSAG